MKTTLQEIWNHNPCCKSDISGGWGLLTKNLGTDDLETEVSLTEILKSNGIKDAVWALRCFDYLDYRLFSADAAVAYGYATDAAARKEKWKEVERIFIKHFGGEPNG